MVVSFLAGIFFGSSFFSAVFLTVLLSVDVGVLVCTAAPVGILGASGVTLDAAG